MILKVDNLIHNASHNYDITEVHISAKVRARNSQSDVFGA